MEPDTTLANVGMGAGIGLWVLTAFGMCLGFIPILNLLGMLIMPINLLLLLTSLGASTAGLMAARGNGGAGMPQAVIGLLCGLGWLAIQALLITSIGALLGLALIFGN